MPSETQTGETQKAESFHCRPEAGGVSRDTKEPRSSWRRRVDGARCPRGPGWFRTTGRLAGGWKSQSEHYAADQKASKEKEE